MNIPSRGICDGIDYKLLNDSSRNVEYGGNDIYTDNSLSTSKSPDWNGPGWYRMIEPAGLQLSEKNMIAFRCGTLYPGYLDGTHPIHIGVEKNMTVCFSWIDDPCYYSSQIQVKSCGDFYLYYLVTPSPEYPSTTRYCSK